MSTRIEQEPSYYRTLIEAGVTPETQEGHEASPATSGELAPARDRYEARLARAGQEKLASYAPLPGEESHNDPVAAANTAYVLDQLAGADDMTGEAIIRAALKLKMESNEIDRDNDVYADAAKADIRKGQRRLSAEAEEHKGEQMIDSIKECPLVAFLNDMVNEIPIIGDVNKTIEDGVKDFSNGVEDGIDKIGLGQIKEAVPLKSSDSAAPPASPQQRAYRAQRQRELSDADREEEQKLIAAARPKVAAAAGVLRRSQQPVPRTIQG